MRRYVIGVLVLWIGYMSVLFFWDVEANGVDAIQHPGVRKAIPGMMMLAFFSYFLRYLRWWRMFRLRNIKWPFWSGCLAYLSGFAFTVTPGKVGELSRIHYLSAYGVSSRSVVSGFFYERCLDLMIVLLLGMMFFKNSSFYPVVVLFVLIIISAVLACVICSVQIRWLARFPFKLGYRRAARLMVYASRVAWDVKGWLQWKIVAESVCLGLVAWISIALALVLLLDYAGLLVAVPVVQAFALYPFAMLAGAASMMPGGIGATEAVMAVSLESFGVDISFAVICAMVTRMATMWFSVVLGFISITILEARRAPAR